MIERSPESTGRVLVFLARGRLTDQDYREVLIPALEEAIAEYGPIRLLLELGDEFKGWEPAALWDDARFGMAHRHDFEKLAVVGPPRWVEWGLKLGALLMSGDVRTYPVSARQQALDWIKA